MRVILVTVGSRGDVVPFQALGEGLASGGHDVVLISHERLLRHAVPGVEVVGVPGDPEALLDGPAGSALRRGNIAGLNRARLDFAALLTSVVGPLLDRVDQADLVIASTFATAAVDAARSRGVPVVRVHLWPEPGEGRGPMPLLPYEWALPAPAIGLARRAQRKVEPLLAGFNGWWERARLHVVPHFSAGFTTTDLGTLNAFSGVVAGYHDPGSVTTGWWRKSGPSELSEDTQRLLSTAGDPWIYLGFGSMPAGSFSRIHDMVAATCRRLSLRAVIQHPQADHLAGAGPVRVIGHEPHDALFPLMSVLVHHGGSGTTGAAVRAGKPSVVVPQVADQFFWGHRLHRLGVAPAPVPRPLLGKFTLTGAVKKALQPDVRRRAQELGAIVTVESGVERAVAWLESAMPPGTGE